VSEDVIVRLPDHTRCALPIWMLDEALCAAMVDAPAPVLPLRALRGLIRLLDLHQAAGANSAHEKHFLARTADTALNAAAAAGVGAANNDSGGCAPAVRDVAGSDTSNLDSARQKGADQ